MNTGIVLNFNQEHANMLDFFILLKLTPGLKTQSTAFMALYNKFLW